MKLYATFDSNQLLIDIMNNNPDVVVMDINLRPDCRFDVIQALSAYAKCKFLILANHSADPRIIDLLNAGARMHPENSR